MKQAGPLRALWRSLRSQRIVNRPLTTGLRAVWGDRSEFLIRHLPRIGDVRASLPDGRTLVLLTQGDDWIADQVFWRGWDGYETETARAFYRLASSAHATIDVGAHVGYYALLAGHANPSGQVVAFEPLAAVHRRLIANVEANRLRNVRCEQRAVGRVAGRADFYHVDEPLPSSSGLSRPFMERVGQELHATPVEVVSLDDLLPSIGIGRVDLVKIDTESTEPDVVAGMMRTVARDRPDIIAEVLDEWETLAALRGSLQPLGYRQIELTVLHIGTTDLRVGVNVLFTCREIPDVATLIRPF